MKKIVKIMGIIIVLLIIFLFVFKFLNRKEDKLEILNEIIEEKQDKIIYVYNSNSEECPLCSDSIKYFDEYKKAYELDVLDIDSMELSKEEQKKLKEMLSLDDDINKRMNIIYIKKGEIVGNLLGELSSVSIGESLYDQGYISKEEYQKEVESLNTDIFNEEEETLVLLGTNVEGIGETKKVVKGIASKNKIGYRYIEVDLAINEGVRRRIREEIGEYGTPLVLVIRDKKIQTYTDRITEEDISDLVKKY